MAENNSRTAQAWAITTFATVIMALGAGGWFQAQSQSEITILLDKFQQERVTALDTLLQKELEKEAQLVVEQFRLADKDSVNRHNQQQFQIDEIKGWFKPPQLRTDGSINQR